MWQSNSQLVPAAVRIQSIPESLLPSISVPNLSRSHAVLNPDRPGLTKLGNALPTVLDTGTDDLPWHAIEPICSLLDHPINSIAHPPVANRAVQRSSVVNGATNGSTIIQNRWTDAGLLPDGTRSHQPMRTSDAYESGHHALTLLRCTWPDCRSEAMFKRKYELDRHMQKHTISKPYPCPVLHCEFSGHRAFYRKDKLRSHLRYGHHDEHIGACPMPSCGMQLPLLILQEHCRRHSIHETNGLSQAEMEGFKKRDLENLTNAIASYGYRGDDGIRSCPIGDCRELVDPTGMQQHLQGHALAQRRHNASAIYEAGYDAETTQPRCPLCDQLIQDYYVWLGHIERAHVALHPNDVIHPHRVALLKMYPEFASHPVFDADWPSRGHR